MVQCSSYEHRYIVFADNLHKETKAKKNKCKMCALYRVMRANGGNFVFGMVSDSEGTPCALVVEGATFNALYEVPTPERQKPGRRPSRKPHESDLDATFYGIKRRCSDPSHPYFHRYGGRGIRMAPEWKDKAVFIHTVLEEIGPRPEGTSLDRTDRNGHYAPGNIRWATPKEQAANRHQGRWRSDDGVLDELDSVDLEEDNITI